MLTKSGAKLMDFGLARATALPVLGGLGSGTRGGPSAVADAWRRR